MEQFGLPLREIKDRFTRSELVLIAWRSQEQNYHFKRKMKKMDMPESEHWKDEARKSGVKRKNYSDGIGPERMPDRFYAQETIKDARGRVIANAGDFNLAQVPGEDARRYFEQVLRIPMPPNEITKIRYEDDMSNEIRQAYGIRR